MNKIITYSAILALAAATAFFGIEYRAEKKVTKEQKSIIQMQQSTIERISGERITISIPTEIKNTAVLGKVESNATVENQAHQLAAIIKRDLEAWQENRFTKSFEQADSAFNLKYEYPFKIK